MKITLTAAVLATISATSVWAQDGTARPAFNWTGSYIGVNAGGASGRVDDAAAYTPANGGLILPYPALLNSQGRSFNAASVLGGGQIGYNWQAANLVWGIEADAQYMRLRGAYDTGVVNGPFGGGAQSVQFANSAQAQGLYTVRGRIGYAVDRTLFYATGGVAFTETSGASQYTIFASPRTLSGAVKTVQTGYALGGGLEHAFSNQLSAKFEYVHAGFNGLNFNTTDSNSIPTGAVTNTLRVNVDVVRVGLNFKFGGPID